MATLININCSEQERNRRLSPLPESLDIGKWNIRGKNVTVVKERDALAYSTPEKTEKISTALIGIYGVRRSINLIEIFKDVIQANLADGISSRAFLPLLLTDGFIEKTIDRKVTYEPLAHMQIALFGQIDESSHLESTLIGARWGVFKSLGKTVTHIPVDDTSGEALKFLNSIDYLKPEKYLLFARNFRPIVSLSEDGHISSIVLRCFSKMDPNKIITDENWAITVISANGRVRGCPLGHAMIVCGNLKELVRT